MPQTWDPLPALLGGGTAARPDSCTSVHEDSPPSRRAHPHSCDEGSRGHLHTGASGPDMVTPWRAQRAALGDPPPPREWLARASVTLRTGLPRGWPRQGERELGRASCSPPPPPLFPSPVSAAASTAVNSSGPEAAAGEKKKALTAGREAWSEGARGWVGVGRGGGGDIQTPVLLRSPHSGSVWDQAWPVAPSLPALRPQSRSRVPPGPPGTRVSEGGGGGEKAPTLCPSA